MKTVKPVSKETYEKIGRAFEICSEYPDVFDNVTMRKFCGMFVDDIIDEGEDLIAARKKAYAGEMYNLLWDIWYWFVSKNVEIELKYKISKLLNVIAKGNGEEDTSDDE